jgi:hypothetical protein
MTIGMSTHNNNNNNNNNKDCKHTVLSEIDLSCTVCGMSRYDQLQNKIRLSKKEEKELEDYINQKHWGMIE